MARRGRSDPRSDEALVRACNLGHPRAAAEAFDALYQRHKDFVLRVALRFAPDIDTALDVLQDTFVQLLRRFPPSGEGLALTAKMTTLLYPIAKNTAITAARKASRFADAEEASPESLSTPADDDHDDVTQLLASLPAHQREALRLRFVDELSLQEVGEALGIPLGTVKSRLHLGIKALRSSPLLREYFD